MSGFIPSQLASPQLPSCIYARFIYFNKQETSIRLLKRALHANDGLEGFLIDGFPRKLDQALEFEQLIAKAKFAIYYECDEKSLP